MRISDWSSDVCSSDLEAGHPFSQRGDDPDNLMARDNRKLGGHFTVDNMEVSPADTAGGHLDQQFPWSRVWKRAGDKSKRTAHRAEFKRPHIRHRKASFRRCPEQQIIEPALNQERNTD